MVEKIDSFPNSQILKNDNFKFSHDQGVYRNHKMDIYTIFMLFRAIPQTLFAIIVMFN